MTEMFFTTEVGCSLWQPIFQFDLIFVFYSSRYGKVFLFEVK